MKNRLKELRSQFNLTQEDLAVQVGVSRQTIISIENERYNPSLELAFKLAAIFEIAIDEIFIYRKEKS